MYTEDNRDSLAVEYQRFIKDTLWLDYWIYAEDLTDYVGHDTLELGHYWDGEIAVDMDTNFVAYELAEWGNLKRKLRGPSNAFVRATIFHELTHHYINQISREMPYRDSIKVNRAYQTGIWIIRNPDMFGSEFIEEGICEYLVAEMGEIITPKRYYIPKTQSDLTNTNNRYKVVYQYSSYYLKTFLDTTGFKKGVKILIANAPPNYMEVLNPELFFDRLEKW